MGVDLKLLPLIGKDCFAAHDIIRLERRSELWPMIEKLPKTPIPGKLSCYLDRQPNGEPGYRRRLLQQPLGVDYSRSAAHTARQRARARQLAKSSRLGISFAYANRLELVVIASARHVRRGSLSHHGGSDGSEAPYRQA